MAHEGPKQGERAEHAGQVQPDEDASPAAKGEASIVQEAKDNFGFAKTYEDLPRRAAAEEADFANDGDFDLDLILERILDYSTVYWDPYATKANRSNAEWCLITEWIAESEPKRRWPDKPLVAPEGAFDSEDHDWFAGDAV